MSSDAVRIEALAKRYRIRVGPPPTLRETLGRVVAPWARRPAAWNEFWALRDVSCVIRRGERLAIIGANGAGKSTLLKILCRIVRPSAGSVRIRGRVASLLEVGTGFHPELSGRENVWLNAAILGMSRRETARRFPEILAFSGIGDFIDTPVKHYSSGMYVRLAFAVAAHVDPEVLVIDEVLAVGDQAFRERCLAHLVGPALHDRTMVIVSHDAAAVRRVATRALWIDHGRIAFDGAVDAAYAAYAAASGAPASA